MNVTTDVARCPVCGEVSVLSDLLAAATDDTAAAVALDRPPSGVRYVPRPGGFELTATTRSGAAFFIVPFICIWSGGSIGGIYGTQIVHHHFDLFQSLFGIPFLLGTVLIGSYALMTVFGRHVLRVDGESATLFTGVGPIGITKRIDLSIVTAVREVVSNSKDNSRQLVLAGPKPVKFGAMLRSDRRQFVVAAMRQALHDQRRGRR